MVAVLDILTVVVLVLCAVSAARRGFFKTAIGLVGTFVALGAAVVFGGGAGDWLNAKWIEDAFQSAVGNYLSNFVTTGEGAPSFTVQLEKLFSSMPDVLREFLSRYSVTAADVQKVIASAVGDDGEIGSPGGHRNTAGKCRQRCGRICARLCFGALSHSHCHFCRRRGAEASGAQIPQRGHGYFARHSRRRDYHDDFSRCC